MKLACNCDTGMRSGGQVHDPTCAGIPFLYGAWMGEHTASEWLKEQQGVIDELCAALEPFTALDFQIDRNSIDPIKIIRALKALAKARGEQ